MNSVRNELELDIYRHPEISNMLKEIDLLKGLNKENNRQIEIKKNQLEKLIGEQINLAIVKNEDKIIKENKRNIIIYSVSFILFSILIFILYVFKLNKVAEWLILLDLVFLSASLENLFNTISVKKIVKKYNQRKGDCYE